MPYFRKLNTLIIHIPKTGGTSLENYFLKKYRFKKNHNNLFNIMKETGISHPLQHCTISELHTIPQFKIDWNQLRIITVVRNPYDRAVSALFWRDAININSTEEEVETKLDHFLNMNYPFDNHNWPQYKFLEYNGEIDKKIIIMRTESLDADMINNGYTDFKNNDNVSYRNKIDYMSFLTESAKKKIYNYYRKDFELFGYDPMGANDPIDANDLINANNPMGANDTIYANASKANISFEQNKQNENPGEE
ncbi:hypothetical protein QJ856_gp0267 [Tupanvirus deep ocean]|uniref:Uncharacterized protein n=2 Tax=Tupanvirus TaxID=2094720 RepID=A0AC62A9L4_9VIRU|nr:hypothetical protein QJ856_gp0267 [Tupanvirus deep ocean]QKU34465.1 hypothetical protein [Tupanvirus deep ocean]